MSTHAQPGKPLVSDSSSEAATTPAAATAPTVAAAALEVVDVVVVEVVVSEAVVVGGAATVCVWITVVVGDGAVTVAGGLGVLTVTVWVAAGIVAVEPPEASVVDVSEAPVVSVSEASVVSVSEASVVDVPDAPEDAVSVACGVVVEVVPELGGTGVVCVRLRLVLRVREMLGPLLEPQPATRSKQTDAKAPAIIRPALGRAQCGADRLPGSRVARFIRASDLPEARTVDGTRARNGAIPPGPHGPTWLRLVARHELPTQMRSVRLRASRR